MFFASSCWHDLVNVVHDLGLLRLFIIIDVIPLAESARFWDHTWHDLVIHDHTMHDRVNVVHDLSNTFPSLSSFREFDMAHRHAPRFLN